MSTEIKKQPMLYSCVVDDALIHWMNAFLEDRDVQGVSPGTIRFYSQKLKSFLDYCDEHEIESMNNISTSFIRQYLRFLELTNHNPGGRHAVFRCLRAFLNWYEIENEPDNWKNPIRHIKGPRVPIVPLDPVSIETIQLMIKSCIRGAFTGDRDIAIILCLLDTGARANEFLRIDLEDVKQVTGEVLIRKGKGGKPREVYIGKRSRHFLKKYLRQRKDNCPALWVTHPRFGAQRLTYDGLREILKRRAREAKVTVPCLHSFRRAFALIMLRNGTDIYTLAKLMGHEGITVLQRYLKQTYQDTKIAHRRFGPVDNQQFLIL